MTWKHDTLHYGRERRLGFAEDFRRFFLRGLAALLPTLITLWLIVWVWNFLWTALGQHIVAAIRWTWLTLGQQNLLPYQPKVYIDWFFEVHLAEWQVKLLGVALAVVLVYVVGLFVGHIIGRTAWRLAEVGVMRIPLVRAIYPAVKQVTDFLLADKKSSAFQASRVVAVQPHARGIWSIGLVTGGMGLLSESVGEEMITVFVPSTPTAFSGYVLVVPRQQVVELPMTVEEAMRLLISGGVIAPAEKAVAPPLGVV
ncbi:MAG TPA: DUF502 domain-containing protein [Tepidisphaeraceae bacterium]